MNTLKNILRKLDNGWVGLFLVATLLVGAVLLVLIFTPKEQNGCPKTPQAVAALLGGKPEEWKRNTNIHGSEAWRFTTSQVGTPVMLNVRYGYYSSLGGFYDPLHPVGPNPFPAYEGDWFCFYYGEQPPAH